jgi:eukaryotic-like serine/threonine-protein kinase
LNETFLRCPHCGRPHEAGAPTCPSTGLALPQRPLTGPNPRGGAGAPAGSSKESHPRAIPPGPVIPGRSAAKGGKPGAAGVRPRAPREGQTEPAPDDWQAHGSPARRQIVGRVIGDKYGVTSMIGEGGMGAVYEAEHLAIGRLVAVKVLHPKHAQKRDAISRMQHEARVVGTIGHPNICEIYDIGRLDDGSPYLVMERLHGETLAERIQRDGSVPYRDLVEIMLQVLSALVAAHEKGIIHRDLKPDNIFLSQRAGMPPVAKLLDFGISKASQIEDTAVDLTRTGMVMGTPYYMAPEQARGDRTLDHRVDLWAVGVVLYEALSGRRPFVARNYNALLVQILTSRHRPVADYKPALPQGLSEVIDKALSKMREDRWQTAGELQEVLLRFKQRTTAPPTPPAGEPDGGRVRWGRRASDRERAGDASYDRRAPAAASSFRGEAAGSARPPQPAAVPVPVAIAEGGTEGPSSEPATTPVLRRPARRPDPNPAEVPRPEVRRDPERTSTKIEGPGRAGRARPRGDAIASPETVAETPLARGSFHDDATIVLSADAVELSDSGGQSEDDTPIYPTPLMDEEEAERTVVDPPSFLDTLTTVDTGRPPRS